MKNILIGAALIFSLALASLYLRQLGKTRLAEATVAGLQQQLGDQQTELTRQQLHAVRLRDGLEDSRAEAAARAGETARLQQALNTQASAPRSPEGTGPARPLGEVFGDPEVREMMKKQASADFNRSFDQNYGKLLSGLELKPEQSAALKELIFNKQTAGMDLRIAVMSQDMSPDARADLMRQIRAERDGWNTRIKESLGEDGYARFDAWEKTRGERTTVGDFRKELAGASRTLESGQEEQLLGALIAEKQGFKFTTDYSDDTAFTGNFAEYFSEDKLTQHFQEQALLHEQYLKRAESILSPEQRESFKTFLTGQREGLEMILRVSAKLFAPKTRQP